MGYEYLEERFRRICFLGDPEKKNIYLAKDEITGQIVVVKYVSKENTMIYQNLFKIWHRNLVHILFVAEGEKDTIVVMEYISGKNLEDYCKEKGRLSEGEALYIVRQIAECLCVIHKFRIIHRDINPKNILLSVDGVVKIVDFDIGRIYKDEQKRDTNFWGTAGYAAPEQFGFSQSDMRTDIYSAGVVLNWMLTGRFPQEYCYQEGKLGKIIQKCIQLEPELRYQSAEEFSRVVQSVYVRKRKVKKVRVKRHGGAKLLQDILPGFRTKKLWKEIFAGYYYCTAIGVSVMNIWLCGESAAGVLLEMIAVFLYMWASALGACNFLHWMEKLPFVQRDSKVKKVIIGTLFWVWAVFVGVMLENFVMEDMLHIR